MAVLVSDQVTFIRFTTDSSGVTLKLPGVLDRHDHHEQNINNALRSGQTVGQTVHLNNQMRTPYGPHSIGWNDPSDSEDSDYEDN